MLFKPELLQKVIEGSKTQTRRLAKDDEGLLYGRVGSICSDIEEYIDSYPRHGVSYIKRERYAIGKTYAACPGRGKTQLARIMITGIRCGVASNISEDDARAEGFASRDEFLQAWDTINGKGKRDTAVWILEFKVV
jgi:hypothetical protein